MSRKTFTADMFVSVMGGPLTVRYGLDAARQKVEWVACCDGECGYGDSCDAAVTDLAYLKATSLYNTWVNAKESERCAREELDGAIVGMLVTEESVRDEHYKRFRGGDE